MKRKKKIGVTELTFLTDDSMYSLRGAAGGFQPGDVGIGPPKTVFRCQNSAVRVLASRTPVAAVVCNGNMQHCGDGRMRSADDKMRSGDGRQCYFITYTFYSRNSTIAGYYSRRSMQCTYNNRISY